MQVLSPLLATLVAYLLGSLSFAVIVSRLMGLKDPRTFGSKNPGATNVLRSGSRAAAVVTLALDGLKGWLPVVLVRWFGKPYGLEDGTMAMVGLAAFAGHLWPVFFRFQGGKGAATAAGVLMAINPALAAATLLSFGIVLAFSRYVSLAAMVAAAFAPFYLALIWGVQPTLLPVVVMCLLLVWRHEGNLRKLIAGTESKLGQKVAVTLGPLPAHDKPHHRPGPPRKHHK